MSELNQARATNEFAEMLEGMTKQELIKYGNLTYGMNLNAKFGKGEIVDAIKQQSARFAYNDDIRVGEQLATEDLKPGYAEVQLHRTELLKGLPSVIVGLQGRLASLPIGARFWCPLELLGVLQDAMRIEYEQDKSVDPPEMVAKEVHAYPFTVFRSNPHTPESKKQAQRKRGLPGRAPLTAQKLREAKQYGGVGRNTQLAA